MSKEQIKKEAESLIEKYKHPTRKFNMAHILSLYDVGWEDDYSSATECAISEVQSKIDLLEECNKHLKEYGLEMLGKLDHQKEILKYLEEL
jgi:hypothetical protein